MLDFTWETFDCESNMVQPYFSKYCPTWFIFLLHINISFVYHKSGTSLICPCPVFTPLQHQQKPGSVKNKFKLPFLMIAHKCHSKFHPILDHDYQQAGLHGYYFTSSYGLYLDPGYHFDLEKCILSKI